MIHIFVQVSKAILEYFYLLLTTIHIYFHLQIWKLLIKNRAYGNDESHCKLLCCLTFSNLSSIDSESHYKIMMQSKFENNQNFEKY